MEERDAASNASGAVAVLKGGMAELPLQFHDAIELLCTENDRLKRELEACRSAFAAVKQELWSARQQDQPQQAQEQQQAQPQQAQEQQQAPAQQQVDDGAKGPDQQAPEAPLAQQQDGMCPSSAADQVLHDLGVQLDQLRGLVQSTEARTAEPAAAPAAPEPKPAQGPAEHVTELAPEDLSSEEFEAGQVEKDPPPAAAADEATTGAAAAKPASAAKPEIQTASGNGSKVVSSSATGAAGGKKPGATRPRIQAPPPAPATQKRSTMIDVSLAEFMGKNKKPAVETAAAAKVPDKANPPDKANGSSGSKRCLHCKQWGHDESQCWHKNPALKPLCTYCDKLGHITPKCIVLLKHLKDPDMSRQAKKALKQWEQGQVPVPAAAPGAAAGVGTVAAAGSNAMYCTLCERGGHDLEGCWRMHPDLAPAHIQERLWAEHEQLVAQGVVRGDGLADGDRRPVSQASGPLSRAGPVSQASGPLSRAGSAAVMDEVFVDAGREGVVRGGKRPHEDCAGRDGALLYGSKSSALAGGSVIHRRSHSPEMGKRLRSSRPLSPGVDAVRYAGGEWDTTLQMPPVSVGVAAGGSSWRDVASMEYEQLVSRRQGDSGSPAARLRRQGATAAAGNPSGVQWYVDMERHRLESQLALAAAEVQLAAVEVEWAAKRNQLRGVSGSPRLGGASSLAPRESVGLSSWEVEDRLGLSRGQQLGRTSAGWPHTSTSSAAHLGAHVSDDHVYIEGERVSAAADAAAAEEARMREFQARAAARARQGVPPGGVGSRATHPTQQQHHHHQVSRHHHHHHTHEHRDSRQRHYESSTY